MIKTRYTKADRRPTWTNVVLDVLVKADDFMNLDAIYAAVKPEVSSQVRAALLNLKIHNCVDSVVGGDGKLWWFATPADDTRSRIIRERAKEEPGNRGGLPGQPKKRRPKSE